MTFPNSLVLNIALGCAALLDAYDSVANAEAKLGMLDDPATLHRLGLSDVASETGPNASVNLVLKATFEAIGMLDQLHRLQLFENNAHLIPSVVLTSDSIAHIDSLAPYSASLLKNPIMTKFSTSGTASHNCASWRQNIAPRNTFETVGPGVVDEEHEDLEAHLRYNGGIDSRCNTQLGQFEQLVANVAYGMFHLSERRPTLHLGAGEAIEEVRRPLDIFSSHSFSKRRGNRTLAAGPRRFSSA